MPRKVGSEVESYLFQLQFNVLAKILDIFCSASFFFVAAMLEARFETERQLRQVVVRLNLEFYYFRKNQHGYLSRPTYPELPIDTRQG